MDDKDKEGNVPKPEQETTTSSIRRGEPCDDCHDVDAPDC